jgi:hypothetical protein
MFAGRVALLTEWEKAADLLGTGGAGAGRLRESQRFIAFLRADLPALMQRRHRYRERHRG